MVKVKTTRKAFNDKLRGMVHEDAVLETKELNDWCENHGVTWEIPNKKDVIAVCPDQETAMLFKLTWL